jgi:hypothetical protein
MRQQLTIVVACAALSGCSAASPTEADQESSAVAETTADAMQTADVASSPPTQVRSKDDAPLDAQTSTANASGSAPSYDTEAYCAQVSNAVGGSYVIEKGCRDEEFAALSTIRARNIPARVFQYCDQVAQSIGGSYVIFNGCVDQELSAAADL